MKKIFVLMGIAGIITAFFYFDVQQYLTLEALKKEAKEVKEAWKNLVSSE